MFLIFNTNKGTEWTSFSSIEKGEPLTNSSTENLMFTHFLNLISVDYKNFFNETLDECVKKSIELQEFQQARGLLNAYSTSQRRAAFKEFSLLKNKKFQEIQQHLNNKFSTNFDVNFYKMIFEHALPKIIPQHNSYLSKTDIAADYCLAFDFCKSAIDYLIIYKDRMRVAFLCAILEIISNNTLKLAIKIPSQNFLYDSKNKSLSSVLESIDCNSDIKSSWDVINNAKIDYDHSYKCSTPIDVLLASLYEITNNKKHINKCDHCGKYFVPFGKSDEKYCSGASPNFRHLNCKEGAKYSQQLERERRSPSNKLYKSIYTMKHRKLINSPLSLKDTRQNDLADFMNTAAIWKENVKSSKASEEEFIEWLNGFKKRGKKNEI